MSSLADLLAEAAQQCTTPRDPEVLRLRINYVRDICGSILTLLDKKA